MKIRKFSGKQVGAVIVILSIIIFSTWLISKPEIITKVYTTYKLGMRELDEFYFDDPQVSVEPVSSGGGISESVYYDIDDYLLVSNWNATNISYYLKINPFGFFNISDFNFTDFVNVSGDTMTGELNATAGITIPNDQTYKFDGDDFITYWASGVSVGKDTATGVSRSTFVGEGAGGSNTGADAIIAIGKSAGISNSASGLTAIGFEAGRANSGVTSTAIGYRALRGNSANYAFGLGDYAGYDNSGGALVAIGGYAGRLNTGFSSVFIGQYAGYGNTGAHSIGMGQYSLNDNVAHYSIGLGFSSLKNNTGESTVAIGFQAGLNNVHANQFILQQTNVNAIPLIQGNFSSGYVGIGTTNPLGQLHLNDNLGTGGKNLIIGDDAFLSDIDIQHVTGLYSMTDATKGGLQLGNNSASTIFGNNGNVGIGTSGATQLLSVQGIGMFGVPDTSEVLLGTSANTVGHEGVSLYHDGTEGFLSSVDEGIAWHDMTYQANSHIFGVGDCDEALSNNDICLSEGQKIEVWNVYANQIFADEDAQDDTFIDLDSDGITFQVAGSNVLFLEGDNMGLNIDGATIDFAIGDTDTGFNWISDGLFTLYNNGGETMRFGSGGHVGVGETTLTRHFNIEDTSDAYPLRVEDSSHACAFGAGAGGITWTCASDERLKRNIRETDSILDLIMKTKVRTFEWKTDNSTDIGFIAQEFIKVAPDRVSIGEDGYYQTSGFSQGEIIKAIQELKQENDLIKQALGDCV